MKNLTIQKGFTLLELLIVVAIPATITPQALFDPQAARMRG